MDATQPDRLHLHSVSGPERNSFNISGEQPAILGRSEECEVALVDPSVSRAHATMLRRGDKWLVSDLGSRNGTYLNGLRLQADQPAVAAPGDFLRVGRYTFRLEFGDTSGESMATTDHAALPGTVIERVEHEDLEALAHRQLELLIEGAAAIHQARTELDLAQSIVDLTLAGSGFRRAAVLRYGGSIEHVEVVASRDLGSGGPDGFRFSRSLLREATSGHIARMSIPAEAPEGQSIAQLRIHSALCAPVMLDASVVGFIYLDARATERPGHPEAVDFCHAVSKLAGLALAGLKRTDLEARQRRLEGDLEAAREAQRFLWPPEQGEVGRLRYTMEAHPGRVIAGDLFDIFEIEGDRIGICIGDVCGQGMGAAILMTALLASLRAALTRSGDPGDTALVVNRYVSDRSPMNVFASLWVGVFDQRSSELSYIDAGHGHWFLKRRDQPADELLRPKAPPLGIDRDAAFPVSRITLAPGDRLVLFSDGILEHRGPSREQFGLERLVEIVGESKDAAGDVKAAVAALRRFIGNVAFTDDTTIASIEVLPGT